MIYGVILAGGIGSRVKGQNIPKQFVELNGKPVVAYTIESMLRVSRFDNIYIAVHCAWMDYMERMLSERFSLEQRERIRLVAGGKERLDSILNVTAAICSAYSVEEDDVIVIHDAARPFVTEKILNDNIDCALEHGAVVTALPASDTMIYSVDGCVVSKIPDRKMIYHGQTPDSFRLKLFLRMVEGLSDKQRKMVTGTSLICTLSNVDMYLVEGDSADFKITTDSDLLMAKSMVGLKD